ncbi:MAG: hypothetical protein LBV75_01065, partial [Paludibacter sp.]|jgi:hypothetical protein|nr:hypothetical protein [Paludibacter sp.]
MNSIINLLGDIFVHSILIIPFYIRFRNTYRAIRNRQYKHLPFELVLWTLMLIVGFFIYRSAIYDKMLVQKDIFTIIADIILHSIFIIPFYQRSIFTYRIFRNRQYKKIPFEISVWIVGLAVAFFLYKITILGKIICI